MQIKFDIGAKTKKPELPILLGINFLFNYIWFRELDFLIYEVKMSRLEFNNGAESNNVRLLDEHNQVISEKNLNNDLFYHLTQLLEERLRGYRWYYNPSVRSEWAFGPHGLTVTKNSRDVIWCYPFNNNHVHLYFSIEFFREIIENSMRYESYNNNFDDNQPLGEFFGHDVRKWNNATTGEWIEIIISENNNFEEVVDFLYENQENII